MRPRRPAPVLAALLALGSPALAACSSSSPTGGDDHGGRQPTVTWKARSTKDGFELSRNGGDWHPFWPIGVNVGLALPGHSPGEFLATPEQIRRWLATAAAAGANCVRIYTVQSPDFYRELRNYDLDHEDAPLFLLQGVWIKEPRGYGPDYFSAELRKWVLDEIEKAVDVVHGDRVIPPGTSQLPMNYGRAFGSFDADVSPWLLGWLFGRELEPYTIEVTYAKHAGATSKYAGTYLSIDGANSLEAWIVGFMDRIVGREKQRYGAQHPIGFSNWPTLDPLDHWTEPKIPVSAEDTYQIDLEPIRTGGGFDAGVFMSYHAYPYYPDFILYQPEYQGFSDAEGKFSYIGYLADLRKHHKDHALIVAEIGHPTSFGNGHRAPSGQDHGGFSEQEQGAALLRSLGGIAQAGLDGAVVFALLDEWFKRAWVVERVEQPAARRKMWLNVMNPEENFGLVALRPGPPGKAFVLDAETGDWSAPVVKATTGSFKPLGDGADGQRRLRGLSVDYDEAFVHVLVRMDPADRMGRAKRDWSKLDLLLAFDTIDKERGDGRLDPAGKVEVGRRVEHVLRIHSDKDVQLLVDKPYDLYGLWHGFRKPWQKYRTVGNDAGQFDLVRTITNAAYEVKEPGTDQWATLGKQLDQETGRFRVGPEAEDSLAMVAMSADGGVIEVRVPWNLLHFTDPSSQRIVDDDGSAGSKAVTTARTGEIAVAAVVLGGTGEKESTLVDSIPVATRTATGYKVAAAGWATKKIVPWDEPQYHERVKPSVAVLGEGLSGVLPSSIAVPGE